MTRTQKLAAVICLWAVPAAAPRAASPYPPCSEVCSWEASCSTSCNDVDAQKEDATCGEYGNCEGADPCDNPSPVWVTYDNSWVGSFADYGYGYDNAHSQFNFYCTNNETRRVRQQDLQACYSARQADRYFCYYVEDERLWAPDDSLCCTYWYCGGSGSTCPEP